MKKPLGLFSLFLLVAGCAQQLSPESIEVAKFQSMTEGPVFDSYGNLFISEPRAGKRVTRITPKGERSVWMVGERPNGHKVLADRTHVLCDGSSVLHLAERGTLLKSISSCDGEAIVSANDLTLDSFGGFYFSDLRGGKVCYVDSNWKSRIVADDLPMPNGVVLRADGRSLIVSLWQARKVVEYPVLAPGNLGDMRAFVEVLADGMALDQDGNLYLAGGDLESSKGYITVVGRDGDIKKTIPLTMSFATNMVFGGADMRRLWVTGFKTEDESGLVYQLQLKDAQDQLGLPR